MERTLLILALLVAGPALADREHQGEELFRARCSNCHAVGRGEAQAKVSHNYVDVTMAARKHPEAWVRAWLKNPEAVKPKSPCYTGGLDATQIDQLWAFLRARAEAPRKHVIAPLKVQEEPPPPDPPKPPPGLVRGR